MTDSLEDKLRKAYSEGVQRREERNQKRREQYKEKKQQESLEYLPPPVYRSNVHHKEKFAIPYRLNFTQKKILKESLKKGAVILLGTFLAYQAVSSPRIRDAFKYTVGGQNREIINNINPYHATSTDSLAIKEIYDKKEKKTVDMLEELKDDDLLSFDDAKKIDNLRDHVDSTVFVQRLTDLTKFIITDEDSINQKNIKYPPNHFKDKTTDLIAKVDEVLKSEEIPIPIPKSKITEEEIHIPSQLEMLLSNITTKVELDPAIYLINFNINIAQNGTLILKPGVYISLKNGSDINVNGSLIAIGKKDNPIKIYGEKTSESITINNWSSTYRGVERKVIFNRVEFSDLASDSGGAIDIVNGAYKIQNCIFQNNHANRLGGAVLIRNSFEVENSYNSLFTNNELRYNTANNGGGLAIQGGGRVTIKDNKIYNNKATNLGGGIYLTETGITISNNEVYSNEANEGGAIATERGNPTVEKNNIYDNIAFSRGGGYYSFSAGGALLNNHFRNNLVNGTVQDVVNGFYLKDAELYQQGPNKQGNKHE